MPSKRVVTMTNFVGISWYPFMKALVRAGGVVLTGFAMSMSLLRHVSSCLFKPHPQRKTTEALENTLPPSTALVLILDL